EIGVARGAIDRVFGDMPGENVTVEGYDACRRQKAQQLDVVIASLSVAAKSHRGARILAHQLATTVDALPATFACTAKRGRAASARSRVAVASRSSSPCKGSRGGRTRSLPMPTRCCASLMSCTSFTIVSMRSKGRNHW